MARLYGEKKDINKDTVQNFFDKRADKKFDNLMIITSFQGKDNLEKRQIEESELLLDKLDFSNKKVLEIGCGLGRWASFFHDKCELYLGIDYSGNLIKLAEDNFNYENCYFQELTALDIDKENLIIEPPFDIIFITGLLIYLNDEDIRILINKINALFGDNKTIYIRETISVMDSRLTLKEFYSDDLKEEYNAIYRTKNELLEFFKEFDNISDIEMGPIFESLNRHSETGYQYFILE